MKLLKLVGCELRKLWSFGYVRFLFVLLLTVNMLSALIYCNEYLDMETKSDYGYTKDDVLYVHQLYENDPEWFEQEYEFIVNKWKEWDGSEPPESFYSKCDWNTFEHVYTDIHAYDNYVSDIEKTLSKAEYLLYIAESYKTDSSNATKEYQEHVIKRYSSLLEKVEPYGSSTYGWRTLFSFSTLPVILFLWTLIISVTIYHEHILTGFSSIARICRKGRFSTGAAKLIAIMLVIVLSVALFTLSTMLVIELMIGFTGGEASVQLLTVPPLANDSTSYIYVPFNLSIRGYTIVNAGLKCLALFAFAALVVFVTSFSNHIFGYISGIILFVWQYYSANSTVLTTDQWRNFNLISICRDNLFLTRLREVTLFGSSVDLLLVVIVCLTAASVIFFLSAAVCFSTKRGSSKQVWVIKTLKSGINTVSQAFKNLIKRRYPMNLCMYELRKSRIVLFVGVILLIVGFGATSEYYKPPATAYDRMYSEIVAKYEGEYTDEKAADISEQYDKYQKVIDEFAICESAFQNGEISESYFFKLYEKYLVAKARIQVYDDLVDQSDHLQNTPGGWYFYDTGVREYADRDNDWSSILFVLLLGAGIFLPEYKKKSSESTTISVIRTSKRGRRSFIRTKLWFVSVSAVIASVVSNAAEIYYYLQNYDTSAINAPIRSIAKYGSMPSWLSVGGFFALTVALSVVGTVILALLTCAVSCIGERAVTVYAVITILLVPYASVMLGMDFMSYADLTRLSDAQRLISLTKSGGLLPTVLYFAAALLSAVLLTRAVHIKTERKS